MKKMLKGLTFAALIALSMLASASDAFAKDSKHGRETAWTDLPTLPELLGVTWEESIPLLPEPIGVPWEEQLLPQLGTDGVTWEE